MENIASTETENVVASRNRKKRSHRSKGLMCVVSFCSFQMKTMVDQLAEPMKNEEHTPANVGCVVERSKNR